MLDYKLVYLHIGLQDEMKINYLQIQLQSEKQERKIDGMEQRFEVKIDEIRKNLNEPWEMVCTEMKNLKKALVN